MMQNMLLQEGDTVRVKNATLPKGTYVKLQPHTKDFLDISNPKAMLVFYLFSIVWLMIIKLMHALIPYEIWCYLIVHHLFVIILSLEYADLSVLNLCSLETTLRNFSCLTTGDSIMVAYNNKKYYIDIVETKPASAISIIETDCEVDFAPPLDYKEPERPQPSVPSSNTPSQGIYLTSLIN